MITNREIFDRLVGCAKERGFTIVNPTWSTGYFLYEMGEDSVAHFRVKELRGWRFGMWFGEDVTLFAQHENNIDKFKPSYSAWCAETPREKFYLEDPWAYTGFIFDILTCIHEDKYIAWAVDAGYDRPADRKKAFMLRVYYYRKKCRLIYKNFCGDVSLSGGGGWLTFPKGQPYPFKCVVLMLKHGKRVRWEKIW